MLYFRCSKMKIDVINPKQISPFLYSVDLEYVKKQCSTKRMAMHVRLRGFEKWCNAEVRFFGTYLIRDSEGVKDPQTHKPHVCMIARKVHLVRLV